MANMTLLYILEDDEAQGPGSLRVLQVTNPWSYQHPPSHAA
jgi:hypothetical protein